MATSTVKCSTARKVSVSSPKATATRTLGHFSAITGSGYRNLEEGQQVQHDASRAPGASRQPAAGHQVHRAQTPPGRIRVDLLSVCSGHGRSGASHEMSRGPGARRREE